MIWGFSSVMVSPLGLRTTAAARPMPIWGAAMPRPLPNMCACATCSRVDHKRQMIEDRDRVLAERDADMHRQIEQAKEAAQAELAEANKAKTRAEADKGAAERRAQEDRATAERLRAELDKQRTDYHQELAELREEIRAEREGMRNERTANAEQFAAVLATVQAATVHPEAEIPTGEQAGRRRTAPSAPRLGSRRADPAST